MELPLDSMELLAEGTRDKAAAAAAAAAAAPEVGLADPGVNRRLGAPAPLPLLLWRKAAECACTCMAHHPVTCRANHPVPNWQLLNRLISTSHLSAYIEPLCQRHTIAQYYHAHQTAAHAFLPTRTSWGCNQQPEFDDIALSGCA